MPFSRAGPGKASGGAVQLLPVTWLDLNFPSLAATSCSTGQDTLDASQRPQASGLSAGTGEKSEDLESPSWFTPGARGSSQGGSAPSSPLPLPFSFEFP